MSTVRCHLLLPGLSLDSQAIASQFGTDSLALPANVRQLAARGKHTQIASSDPKHAFVPSRGAAALMFKGGGGELGDYAWMCADPVHLRIEQDRLVLLDAEFLNPELAEARALVATLNAHFAADGIEFFAPTAQRWYMRMASPASIETSPLDAVLGRDIHSYLPRGQDAMIWHRRVNELQMLLHSHPVNEAREQRGALPINSVWWWGEGQSPDIDPCFSTLVGDDAFMRGLAAVTDTPITTLPDSAETWLAGEPAAGEHLIAIHSLRRPWAYRMAIEWHTALATLEADWIGPLARALRSGQIGELQISVFSTGHRLMRITRPMLWRFWRN